MVSWTGREHLLDRPLQALVPIMRDKNALSANLYLSHLCIVSNLLRAGPDSCGIFCPFSLTLGMILVLCEI
jgi:hypothetical protein